MRMLGKIIGAIAGERAARHLNGVNSPMGAALGAGAVSLARRFGPLGLLAAVAGGYAFKRYREKRDRQPDGQVPGQP